MLENFTEKNQKSNRHRDNSLNNWSARCCSCTAPPGDQGGDLWSLHILDEVSGNPAPVGVWQVDILQAGEERASEGLCSILQHLWGDHQEDGDRLFTTVHSRRERIAEQVQGKHFSFSGKSTSRRSCPEKVFQTQLDKDLYNPIWAHSWPLVSTVIDYRPSEVHPNLKDLIIYPRNSRRNCDDEALVAI